MIGAGPLGVVLETYPFGKPVPRGPIKPYQVSIFRDTIDNGNSFYLREALEPIILYRTHELYQVKLLLLFGEQSKIRRYLRLGHRSVKVTVTKPYQVEIVPDSQSSLLTWRYFAHFFSRNEIQLPPVILVYIPW